MPANQHSPTSVEFTVYSKPATPISDFFCGNWTQPTAFRFIYWRHKYIFKKYLHQWYHIVQSAILPCEHIYSIHFTSQNSLSCIRIQRNFLIIPYNNPPLPSCGDVMLYVLSCWQSTLHILHVCYYLSTRKTLSHIDSGGKQHTE